MFAYKTLRGVVRTSHQSCISNPACIAPYGVCVFSDNDEVPVIESNWLRCISGGSLDLFALLLLNLGTATMTTQCLRAAPGAHALFSSAVVQSCAELDSLLNAARHRSVPRSSQSINLRGSAFYLSILSQPYVYWAVLQSGLTDPGWWQMLF